MGFRNYVQHKARKMKITGWTRNLSDNRVEVVAQGEEQPLNELVKICHRGPFLAQVEDVEVFWEEPDETFSEFVKKPTE